MVDRPSHKGEMEFESLKLSKINEYGTITGSNPVLTTKNIEMENTLVKLLLTKWIELKSDGDRKTELLNELEIGDKFRYLLGKSSSGNDILSIEFYSPYRIDYSVNLNELIISK